MRHSRLRDIKSEPCGAFFMHDFVQVLALCKTAFSAEVVLCLAFAHGGIGFDWNFWIVLLSCCIRRNSPSLYVYVLKEIATLEWKLFSHHSYL